MFSGRRLLQMMRLLWRRSRSRMILMVSSLIWQQSNSLGCFFMKLQRLPQSSFQLRIINFKPSPRMLLVKTNFYDEFSYWKSVVYKNRYCSISQSVFMIFCTILSCFFSFKNTSMLVPQMPLPKYWQGKYKCPTVQFGFSTDILVDFIKGSLMWRDTYFSRVISSWHRQVPMSTRNKLYDTVIAQYIQIIILLVLPHKQIAMQGSVEKVKIITLVDNKGKQEKYMLLENILGKGKYGKVYKAVHVDNPDKVFAVKVIKLESQKIRDECLKQLQIVRHLPKSLNLVQIHSQHLESNNNFYLFEQFCEGGNLYEHRIVRKGKPYTEEEIYNMFFQIISGFLDLRRGNIFHEDIKPQNILIKNNLYKLTDFGISQLANRIEVSEVRKGTLIYMPPEKLKASTYIPTSKSQIFSLGVTLFEVIFGFHPYLTKKPDNYMQYLKIINETPLKPLEQLKQAFPSHSLCTDKLIRIILRMIELNESKRLSLQELEDYIKNTEPFKSMVISEVELGVKRKADRNVKYQAIGHSQVIVKSQNGMGELLAMKPISNKQRFETSIETLKICLQLFRDASAFLQQGIIYSKDSKVHEFKKQEANPLMSMNKMARITGIQFVSLLFIERMFNQLQTSVNTLIFQSELKVNEESLCLSIEEDKEYISNEFLKFYMEVNAPQKKEIWTNLKERGNQIGHLLQGQLSSIYSAIDCVRINFKEDMLAVLFVKFSGCVIGAVNEVLESICAEDAQKMLDALCSQGYKKCKESLLTFSSIENQKSGKVREEFCKQMVGHEVLEDDQSNSDEFEVLDLSDI